jgi:hypothetical protein
VICGRMIQPQAYSPDESGHRTCACLATVGDAGLNARPNVTGDDSAISSREMWNSPLTRTGRGIGLARCGPEEVGPCFRFVGRS